MKIVRKMVIAKIVNMILTVLVMVSTVTAIVLVLLIIWKNNLIIMIQMYLMG